MLPLPLIMKALNIESLTNFSWSSSAKLIKPAGFNELKFRKYRSRRKLAFNIFLEAGQPWNIAGDCMHMLSPLAMHLNCVSFSRKTSSDNFDKAHIVVVSTYEFLMTWLQTNKFEIWLQIQIILRIKSKEHNFFQISL